MKKRRQPWSLRTFVAMASIISVFATVAICYFGLTIYGERLSKTYLSNMSPAAQRAQKAFNEKQMPSMEDFTALTRESEGVEDYFQDRTDFALLILSLGSATLGAVLSVVLANRLCRPIGEVAATARRISAGELSARAAPFRGDVGETSALVKDFNKMAAALEGYERELIESSAAIAHELRTPLTVLRGYVQGAIDGVFPPSEANMALLMVHIESLSRIVDDLQILTLAGSGALTLAVEPVDARSEITLALDALEPAIAAAGMKIDRNLQAATVYVDAIRIRQAITALVQNASNYATSGKVISVTALLQNKDFVLRVEDRGPGLSERQLDQCFDRFWRGDPSRDKKTGGSGLGLSVVEAIAKAHKGEVRMSNRLGGGLCAQITVPQAIT